MIQFKQFKIWATGSDLINQVKKSRVKLTILTGLFLALFLGSHIFFVINITTQLASEGYPLEQSRLSEAPTFARSLLTVTFEFWLFLVFVFWFLLYFILKPVSEAIKTKENFIANAHHELKTPLTVLKSELDLFDMYNLTNYQKTDIIGMKFQVEKMINLTTHLLSNLTKNKELLLLTNVNVYTTIVNNIDIIKKIYPDAKLQIYLNLDQSYQIHNNEILFKQLVLSIIENSFKHSRHIENPTLHISLADNVLCFVNSTDRVLINKGNGLSAILAISEQIKIKTTFTSENGFFSIKSLL
jgi:signal transduction histidine kinase